MCVVFPQHGQGVVSGDRGVGDIAHSCGDLRLCVGRKKGASLHRWNVSFNSRMGPLTLLFLGEGKQSFFKNLWNLFDIVVALLCIIVFFAEVVRYASLSKNKQRCKEKISQPLIGPLGGQFWVWVFQ